MVCFVHSVLSNLLCKGMSGLVYTFTFALFSVTRAFSSIFHSFLPSVDGGERFLLQSSAVRGQERAGGREQFRVGESRLFRPFLPVFEAFFMLQVKSRDRILIPTVSLAGPVAARSSAALDFAVLGEFFSVSLHSFT